MRTPPTQDNQLTNPEDNTKKPKRKRKKRRQTVCQICHQRFPSLTAEHLRTHGFTLTRYRRAFQASTRAGRAAPLTLHEREGKLTVLDLAGRIVSDPQVIRDLAGEVAEAIFSTSLREQLRLSLVSLLAQRLDAHGKATAALGQVREEMTERWRIEQGGQNGAPTPTKDLVSLHQALTQEIKQSEDLLTRAVKLALDEKRALAETGSISGGLDPDRYTGSAEILPIPPSLTAGDRETIRTLWGMFDRALTARRTLVDVEVSDSRPADRLPAESADSLPPDAVVENERSTAGVPDSGNVLDDDNPDSAPDEFEEPF